MAPPDRQTDRPKDADIINLKDIMAISVEAKTRLVDVLAGLRMPEGPLTLNGILLARSPGPDGILYDTADVISSMMTSIFFEVDNHRMLSAEATSFPLREGVWAELFVLLSDGEGNPYAFGRVRTADGEPASKCIHAAKNRIEIRYGRTLG